MYSSHADVGHVWAIKTTSGLSGPIPFNRVRDFLNVLARHVSPHFHVLRFLPEDGASSMNKLRIRVNPQEVVFPSCLRWPPEMMLTTTEETSAG